MGRGVDIRSHRFNSSRTGMFIQILAGTLRNRAFGQLTTETSRSRCSPEVGEDETKKRPWYGLPEGWQMDLEIAG